MTKQHKATPDEGAQQEDLANRSVFSSSSCILELRDRVEALEAGQQPPQDKLDRLIAIDRDDSTEAAAQQPLAFTGKVVAPITRDRDDTGDYIIVHDTPAFNSSLVERVGRAAILEVAAAILDRWDSEGGSAWEAAKWLEQEASRG